MQLSRAQRLAFVLFAVFGCLIACGNCGLNFPPPPVNNGLPPDPPPLQPALIIDCGLKDVWDKGPVAPIQMEISPDGKRLLCISHSNKDNIQVWNLDTHQK